MARNWLSKAAVFGALASGTMMMGASAALAQEEHHGGQQPRPAPQAAPPPHAPAAAGNWHPSNAPMPPRGPMAASPGGWQGRGGPGTPQYQPRPAYQGGGWQGRGPGNAPGQPQYQPQQGYQRGQMTGGSGAWHAPAGADGNWRGGGNRYADARGAGNWNHNWRGDNRYDWRGWRDENRDAFHAGRYFPPYRGYYYSRLSIGYVLPELFYAQDYWITDPGYYHLPPAYGPYQWVRYYDDALLVNVYNGQVQDVIYGFFW